MKKRLLISFAFVAIIATVAGLVLRANRVPIYKGKSLDIWSAEAYSGDPAQREEAASALQAMGYAAVPRLIRLLKLEDSMVSKAVWNHAKSLPSKTRNSVLQNFRPPTAATVRTAAARSLGLIGTNAVAAVPDLVNALADHDRGVCLAASDALACIGPRVLPDLVVASKNSNAAIRYWSIHSIGLFGPVASNTIPLLIQRLGDQSSDVSTAAATALAQIGPPAVPAILDAVFQGKGTTRQGAAKAVRFALPSRRRAVPPLLEMLQDPDPASRIEAIQTLTVLGANDSNTVAKLEVCSNDTDLAVRAAAIEALKTLRGTPSPVLSP